jgi:hypothetical protein
MQNTKEKKKKDALKAIREEKQTTFEEATLKLGADFSMTTMLAKVNILLSSMFSRARMKERHVLAI